MPDSVTEIGDFAFADCTSLKSIILSKNLEILGSSAFSNSGLEKITIPDSTIVLGIQAFNECRNLKEVNLSDNIKNIYKKVFSGCEKLEKINMPKNLEHICSFAFASCFSLKKIDLPENLTEIEEHAFAYCKSLEKVNLPESITEIGHSAFVCCKKLLDITIPSKIKVIERNTFADCDNLYSVNLPDNIKVIKEYAFENCLNLNYININDNTDICSSAFDNDLNLEDEVCMKIVLTVIKNKKNLIIDLDYLEDMILNIENNDITQEILSINPIFFGCVKQEDREIFLEAILDDIEKIYTDGQYTIIKSPLCNIKFNNNNEIFTFSLNDDFDDYNFFNSNEIEKIKNAINIFNKNKENIER